VTFSLWCSFRKNNWRLLLQSVRRVSKSWRNS